MVPLSINEAVPEASDFRTRLCEEPSVVTPVAERYLAAVTVNEPVPMFNAEVVVLFSRVTPAELEMVRLLNTAGEVVPPMVCAVVPLKVKVLPVEVKVAPLFSKFPPTLCERAPAVKVAPDPSTRSPLIDMALPGDTEAVPERV